MLGEVGQHLTPSRLPAFVPGSEAHRKHAVDFQGVSEGGGESTQTLLLSVAQCSPPPHLTGCLIAVGSRETRTSSAGNSIRCELEGVWGSFRLSAPQQITGEYFPSFFLLFSLMSHGPGVGPLAALAGRYSLKIARQFPVHNPFHRDCL